MSTYIIKYLQEDPEEVEADSFDEIGHEGRWLQFFSREQGAVLTVRTADVFSIRQK
jgi:hypothetical protein